MGAEDKELEEMVIKVLALRKRLLTFLTPGSANDSIFLEITKEECAALIACIEEMFSEE